jgi:hypothetical protein
MKKTMVVLCGVLIALGVSFGADQARANQARANQADLPKEAGVLDSVVEIMSELRAVQLAEMALLDAQQKFYEIVRMSFEGGRELTNTFSNQSLQTGAEVFGSGVTVVLDAKLAQLWFRGVAPTALLAKEVWAASRGNTTGMRAAAQRVWSTVQTLWAKAPLAKNVASTAAIGTFAYIQYETYWVINMSEEQYQASLAALDTKIQTVALQKQEIANQFNSMFVR